MRHHAFYTKYKVRDRKLPMFSKRNAWSIILMTIGIVLCGPVIMYRHYYKSVPFSLTYYKQLISYLLIVYIPLIAFLFWRFRRELLKRSRGYAWVGKFKVAAKRSSFLFFYLMLIPGSDHRIKVNRSLFEKIRVGDFIVVRRDAIGKIENVTKINFTTRLSMNRRLSDNDLRSF